MAYETAGPVLERFPDQAAVIRRRMIADPLFRTICDDYAAAVAALHRFESLPSVVGERRRAEYQVLVLGLEREIRQALGIG